MNDEKPLFTKAELDVYRKQGLGSTKIAQITNTKISTIEYYLNKYGFYGSEETRDVKKEKIKLDKRLQTNKRRRTRKNELVDLFGGKCQVCGYDRCDTALTFHHLNPATKSFTISKAPPYTKKELIISEAKKCMLLCFNCHQEYHAGLLNIEPFLTDEQRKLFLSF